MHWFFSATAILIGLTIGSFLNVVIYRGPQHWGLVDGDSRGNLAFPRSYCPACKAPIKRVHLAPLIGFFALKGKCAACGAAISWRYPLIEFLGACSGLCAYLLFGPTLAALGAAVFFWALIALAAIDLDTGYLPDAITIPLLIVGLAINGAGGVFTGWQASLIGAIVGYLIFRLIGEAFERLRGIEGLGQGDAKLLGALGAWLGWQALAPVVFIASLTGLCAVVIMRLKGRAISRETALPFGPALAFSGAAAMALGPGGIMSQLP